MKISPKILKRQGLEQGGGGFPTGSMGKKLPIKTNIHIECGEERSSKEAAALKTHYNH